MDLLNIFVESPLIAPTRAEIQLEMAEAEKETPRCRGLANWLSAGLKIEETQ